MARKTSATARIPKTPAKRVDWVRSHLPADRTIEDLARGAGLRPDTAIEVIEAGGGVPLAKPFAERLCTHLDTPVEKLFPESFAPAPRAPGKVPTDGAKREKWVADHLTKRGSTWQEVARFGATTVNALRAAVRNGKGKPEIKKAGQKLSRLLHVRKRDIFPHGFPQTQKLRISDVPRDDDARRNWIRVNLSDRDYTIPNLAEDTGVDSDEITRIIRHGGGPGHAKPAARHIAHILEIDLDRLFPTGFSAAKQRLRVRDIPTDPDKRKEWIQQALDRRGSSFADAAKSADMWKGSAISIARDGGGRRADKPIGEYIAATLELPMDKLFPDGFTDAKHYVTDPVDPRQIPRDDDGRYEWIHDQLRQRGWTWNAIARESDYGLATIMNVVYRGGGRRSSARLGEFIAEKLGAPVEALFPLGFQPKHPKKKARAESANAQTL